MRRIKRSKLHRDIKRKLGLGRLGFKSERWIGKHRVDEVNYDHRVVVEVNGDAVHGNPRIYDADSMLAYGIIADDKWTQDADRLTFLEEHGWNVIVVWESDDIGAKRALIDMALRAFPSGSYQTH